MNISKLQAILSILIVASFLIVTALITLIPVLGGYPPGPFIELLKTFSSLYSGIIGIIIGFYFGKQVGDSGN